MLRVLIDLVLNILRTPIGYKFDYIKSIFRIKLLNRDYPWMNYKVIRYLESISKGNLRVFEYGSGSSTLYWMKNCLEIISVEHDKGFYNFLKNKISNKVTYLLVEPSKEKESIKYNPSSYESFHSADSKGMTFEKYVKAIDSYPDEYFDLVVVDGRARPSCIARSLFKIKRGGMLIVDNSDRGYYFTNTANKLIGWEQLVFRGTVRGLVHMEQTSIFIKPQI